MMQGTKGQDGTAANAHRTLLKRLVEPLRARPVLPTLPREVKRGPLPALRVLQTQDSLALMVVHAAPAEKARLRSESAPWHVLIAFPASTALVARLPCLAATVLRTPKAKAVL